MGHDLTAPAELSFRRYSAEALSHAHDFDQIVLPRRGVLEIEIDGKGGRVDPGSAAVIPPGARHVCAADGENLFVVADIDDMLMRPFERLREKPFAPVTGAVRGLLEFLAGEGPGAIENGVAGLWTPLLLRGLSTAPIAIDPRLARAAAMIEARYDQPLTVRDLAGEAGMSQSPSPASPRPMARPRTRRCPTPGCGRRGGCWTTTASPSPRSPSARVTATRAR